MKVIVFGAGYWGSKYIRELGHHCVLAVDPNEDALALARFHFGIPTAKCLYGSELIDYDGAVVATPAQYHYEVALPLLKAGKKVLIEKPLALTVREAEELASYPNCMAGLVYLYHPEVERLRYELDDFAVSELSHVYTRRTNDGPVRPGINALWDLAPHDVSILNHIAGGPPHEAKATSRPDWAILEMNYGYFEAVTYVSWHGSPKVRRVEIVPVDGARLVFNDMVVVLEDPPLSRMVRAFLSGNWGRSTGLVGADVVKVLAMAESRGRNAN